MLGELKKTISQYDRLTVCMLIGLVIFFMGINTSSRLSSYALMGLVLVGLFEIIRFHKFDASDRKYFIVALIIPLVYFLNMAIYGWDSEVLDRPLRLLWSVPIFYALRRIEIKLTSVLVILMVSAMAMCIIGSYHVFFEGVTRGFSGSMKTGPYGNYSAIFLAIGFYFITKTSHRNINVNLILAFFLLLSSGIAMIISGTRSGWVGAFVLVFFIVINRIRKIGFAFLLNRSILFLAVIATVIFLLAGNYIAHRAETGLQELSNIVDAPDSTIARETSIGQRVVSWRLGIDFFRSEPVFGVGFANFKEKVKEAVEQRHLPVELTGYNGFHNFVIDHLAKTGIVGTAGILLFWFFAFRLFYSETEKEGEAGDARFLGILVLIGEIIFSTFGSMFASSIGSNVFILLLAVFAAIANRASPIQKRSDYFKIR